MAEFGGPHGEREPITGVQGQSPWSGGQGSKPPEAERRMHYHNLRTRPICPEICFCRTKECRRTSVSTSPSGSAIVRGGAGR